MNCNINSTLGYYLLLIFVGLKRFNVLIKTLLMIIYELCSLNKKGQTLFLSILTFKRDKLLHKNTT